MHEQPSVVVKETSIMSILASLWEPEMPGKLVSDLSVGIFVYCSLFETVSYGSKAFSLLSFVSLF